MKVGDYAILSPTNPARGNYIPNVQGIGDVQGIGVISNVRNFKSSFLVVCRLKFSEDIEVSFIQEALQKIYVLKF